MSSRRTMFTGTRNVRDSWVWGKAVWGTDKWGDRREGDTFTSYDSPSYSLSDNWDTSGTFWASNGQMLTSGGHAFYKHLTGEHMAKISVGSSAGSPLILLAGSDTRIVLADDYQFYCNGSLSTSGAFGYSTPYDLKIIRAGSYNTMFLKSGGQWQMIFEDWSTPAGSKIGVGAEGTASWDKVVYYDKKDFEVSE